MAKYTNYASYGKSSKSSKFNSKKNYSSFWMDDDNDYYTSSNSKFAGLGSTKRSASDDIVKVIKLASYQRAIANFVKILTKKNIPVIFKGDTSYTDFESVVLSTDIKDTNFDVSVGLALHEGSHIILTDPMYLTKMNEDYSFKYSDNSGYWSTWKNMVNWIEDRRIDNFIFKTSPGYKAYYHKMYDHYWNDKNITKGLLSSDYRDPSDINDWFFRIINSLNPASQPNALPRLAEILQLIDTPHISRLTSVQEVGDIATKVLDIMLEAAKDAKDKKEEQEAQQGATGPKGNGAPMESTGGEGTDSGEEEATEGEGKLTTGEAQQVSTAIRKQKDFLEGRLNKKAGTKSLTNKLRDMSKTNVEVQNVGGGNVPDVNCLIYDLTGDDKVSRLADVNVKMCDLRSNASLSWGQRNELGLDSLQTEAYNISSILPDGFSSYRAGYEEHIQTGTDMGALLGKKLQVRNEVRELVHNRMRTGSIDNKRLASAGYGIESIFKQVHMDQYKKANLHISLDGSGSMGGEKWTNTIVMTMAIAKAATYVQNLDIQVSIRVTNSSGQKAIPVVVNCYDSRKNNLRQLRDIFSSFSPQSMTPEGLCFDAMIKRNMMVTGGGELDSYFLNISDGQPGGVNGYEGVAAQMHTQKQINILRKDYNMSILGFYMNNHPDFLNTMGGQREFSSFQVMYGVKDSKVVAANDAIGIAKALNEKFLAGSSKI